MDDSQSLLVFEKLCEYCEKGLLGSLRMGFLGGSKDSTPMHVAASRGHFQVFRYLDGLDPHMISKRNTSGHTPYHLAILHDHLDIVEEFSHKASLTPKVLGSLIPSGPFPRVLEYLLTHSDISPICNHSKQTLLHVAAESGQLEAVQTLLRFNYNIDATDVSKRTPLFLAVLQNRLKIVQLLLQFKANIGICADGDESVLHVAVFYGFKEVVEVLLASPGGVQLMEARDCDGKTPLHSAVWGVPKPDIVELLLSQGANPQSPNHQGFTPLHWAAKNAHIESLQILLKHGAQSIPNDNNDRPIDLAAELQLTKVVSLLLEATPNDIHYSLHLETCLYKQLRTARADNDTAIQVFSLEKLSLILLKKDEVLDAAKILNCAIAVLCKSGEYTEEHYVRLLLRLEEIERAFLLKQFKIVSEKRGYVYKLREKLKGIKEAANGGVLKKGVDVLLKELTHSYKKLFVEIIDQAQEMLGVPPGRWACIGMGSMARDEMLPYADLEFAFLVEESTYEVVQYFRDLTQIIQLKVINMGETPLAIFGSLNQERSPTPQGLCMDWNGNTPFGIADLYELIGTPKEIAAFQSRNWLDQNSIVVNALSSVCYLSGEQELYKIYQVEKQITQHSQKDNVIFCEYLTRSLIDEYRYINYYEPSGLGIKKQFYRPFQALLHCLTLLLKLKARNGVEIIEELKERNIIGSFGEHNLKKAFLNILKLRLEAQLHYKDENAIFMCPSLIKTRRNALYLDDEHLQVIVHITRVLLALHRVVKEFVASKDVEVFYYEEFCDEVCGGFKNFLEHYQKVCEDIHTLAQKRLLRELNHYHYIQSPFRISS